MLYAHFGASEEPGIDPPKSKVLFEKKTEMKKKAPEHIRSSFSSKIGTRTFQKKNYAATVLKLVRSFVLTLKFDILRNFNFLPDVNFTNHYFNHDNSQSLFSLPDVSKYYLLFEFMSNTSRDMYTSFQGKFINLHPHKKQKAFSTSIW